MNFDLRTKRAPTSRSRTALPLGQLGHCLRLPSGRGPQNFEERKDSKKKISFKGNSKKSDTSL